MILMQVIILSGVVVFNKFISSHPQPLVPAKKDKGKRVRKYFCRHKGDQNLLSAPLSFHLVWLGGSITWFVTSEKGLTESSGMSAMSTVLTNTHSQDS